VWLGEITGNGWHALMCGIYGWQVREGETHETNTAACGSLILEMGMLSELTGKCIATRNAAAQKRRGGLHV
jgi:hypothetical protein